MNLNCVTWRKGQISSYGQKFRMCMSYGQDLNRF